MSNVFGMQIGEAGMKLTEPDFRLLFLDAAPGPDEFQQIPVRRVLHEDEDSRLPLQDAVHADHVRMVQGGHDRELPREESIEEIRRRPASIDDFAGENFRLPVRHVFA